MKGNNHYKVASVSCDTLQRLHHQQICSSDQVNKRLVTPYRLYQVQWIFDHHQKKFSLYIHPKITKAPSLARTSPRKVSPKGSAGPQK